MPVAGLVVRALGGGTAASGSIGLLITRGLLGGAVAVTKRAYNVIANRIHRRGRK